MKPIAIIYYLISILYSVELRYSPIEEDNYRAENIAVTLDNGTIRREIFDVGTTDGRLQGMLLPHFGDVTIYLYTRKNFREGVSFKPNDVQKLKASDVFDPKKPNVFIIHGWTRSHKSVLCVMAKNAILKKVNINVFVVDWSRPASWLYMLARSSVRGIGNFLAQFINDMITTFSLSPSAFKIIGHSLGAHLAGCTGNQVNGTIDYIIGLDPASPLYAIGDPDRLHTSAASFVQVIHTNALFLGFDSSLGHVDIYPNDGHKQPGCEIDLTQSCSHVRSLYFFIESILTGGFTTKKCTSYQDYKAGYCKNNHSSYLGRLNIDKTARGDYYLDTNPQRPFSKN